LLPLLRQLPQLSLPPLLPLLPPCLPSCMPMPCRYRLPFLPPPCPPPSSSLSRRPRMDRRNRLPLPLLPFHLAHPSPTSLHPLFLPLLQPLMRHWPRLPLNHAQQLGVAAGLQRLAKPRGRHPVLLLQGAASPAPELAARRRIRSASCHSFFCIVVSGLGRPFFIFFKCQIYSCSKCDDSQHGS
jgi:hypothetical protein